MDYTVSEEVKSDENKKCYRTLEKICNKINKYGYKSQTQIQE